MKVSISRQLAVWTAMALLTTAAFAATGPIWSPMGPELILQGEAWDERIPATARINVLAVNPLATNPLEEVWLGTAGGGVWKGSLVKAAGWMPMTDGEASLSVGALALDDCTADGCLDIWVGTGENGLRRDTQYGAGILKGRRDTPTSAVTWKSLGANWFRYGSITRLLLDPKSSGAQKVVYAALSSGLSSNARHAAVTTLPKGDVGIWRSTNAGVDWQPVLAKGEIATDLEMDPITPQTLFAALRGEGLFRSQDGGTSWQQINNGLPASLLAAADWPELAVTRDAAMSAARLYVVLGDCPHPQAKQPGQPQHCSPAVYRSDDGGDSWDLRIDAKNPVPASGEPLTTYASYTHALTVHPENPDVLYYGGINLYRSSNGGKTWTTVGAKSLHPNHHALSLVKAEGFPNQLAFLSLTDGGLAVGDGDKAWNSAWQNGLDIALFHSVASRGRLLVGGTQGNGTNAYVGGPAWLHIDDGEAGATLIDRNAGQALLTARNGIDPRACRGGGLCAFDWLSIAGDAGTPQALPQSPNTSWFPPMAQDSNPLPAGDYRLYFAGDGLYASGGALPPNPPDWTLVAPPGLGGFTTFPELDGIINPITALAVAPTSSERLYLGYYDGKVLTTEDATATFPKWTLAAAGLPERPVTALAVSPSDENIVVAAFAGLGGHSLYKSVDHGQSWEPFDAATTPALAEEPVNDVIINPSFPHQVWVATDQGVFTRPNLDGPTELFEKVPGLPNVAVYGLEMAENDTALYVATHGRGVWRLGEIPRLDVTYQECCDDGSGNQKHPYLAVTGLGFDPKQSCELSLYEGGTLCGTTQHDPLQGVFHTDDRGRLASTAPVETYKDMPLLWACQAGYCPAIPTGTSCDIDSVIVKCGDRMARQTLVHWQHEEMARPAHLTLQPVDEGGIVVVSVLNKDIAGVTEKVCEVTAEYGVHESQLVILQRLADAIESATDCQRGGIAATLKGGKTAGPWEGEWSKSAYLAVSTSIASMIATYTEVSHWGPGEIGTFNYGNPATGRLVVPSLTISGASILGREVIYEIESPLGRYRGSMPTEDPNGNKLTATEIATNLGISFAGRDTGGGIPIIGGGTGGPPKKVWAALVDGTTVYFPQALSIKVINRELGLGFKIGVSH